MMLLALRVAKKGNDSVNLNSISTPRSTINNLCGHGTWMCYAISYARLLQCFDFHTQPDATHCYL